MIRLRYRPESLIKRLTYLQFFFLILLNVNCAGPSSPFGALKNILPEVTKVTENMSHLSPLSKTYKEPKFAIEPLFQVLHDKSPLFLRIKDPQGIPDDFILKVYFNGYDITERFYRRSTISLNPTRTEVSFDYSSVRLLAGKASMLQFSYQRSENSKEFITNYSKPPCDLFEDASVKTTAPFRVKRMTMDEIAMWSKEQSINPAFMTGLIAQESAFNTRAVSWSKAVGLTQVTPIANKEIIHNFKNWPQSERIRRLPAALLKTEIRKGNIRPKDDWRLQSSKSIQGGVKYVDYLVNYWNKKPKQNQLKRVYKNLPIPMTDIVLSSYNSGAARVHVAMKSLGRSYLQSNQLNEARYYVDRVKSYCYHFSNPSQEEGESL